jgi:hypothetical protein
MAKTLPNKWNAKKLTVCNVHGDRHLLSSGLCTDLGCVKKVIWEFCKTWAVIRKNWKIIVSLGLDDDCAIFLVAELLREEKEYNKKPTLNPWWLKFRLKKYMVQGVKKSNLPIQSVPDSMKNIVDKHLSSYDAIKEANADFFEDMLYNASTHSNEEHIDLERGFMHKELMTHIGAKFGEPMMMLLKDEINRREFIAMSGLTIEGALAYHQFAKENVRWFWVNGEWQFDIDEKIKSFFDRYGKKQKS